MVSLQPVFSGDALSSDQPIIRREAPIQSGRNPQCHEQFRSKSCCPCHPGPCTCDSFLPGSDTRGPHTCNSFFPSSLAGITDASCTSTDGTPMLSCRKCIQ